MFNKQPEQGPQQVPAKSTPQVSYVGPFSTLPEVEKAVNEFLETITDEKRLTSNILVVNPKTGDYFCILTYNNVRPFTTEELVQKRQTEKQFLAPFQKTDADGKVEKL